VSSLFYLMSLAVFVRYSRGTHAFPGQQQQTPHPTFDAAAHQFMLKFRQKTGNEWLARKNFQPQPGKYVLLDMHFGRGEDDDRMAEEHLRGVSSLQPNSGKQDWSPFVSAPPPPQAQAAVRYPLPMNSMSAARPLSQLPQPLIALVRLLFDQEVWPLLL
jgi:hypothetical protein